MKNNNTRIDGKVELIKPNITSIDFSKSEIIGENHYGFKYTFNIGINTSSNLEILNFVKPISLQF